MCFALGAAQTRDQVERRRLLPMLEVFFRCLCRHRLRLDPCGFSTVLLLGLGYFAASMVYEHL